MLSKSMNLEVRVDLHTHILSHQLPLIKRGLLSLRLAAYDRFMSGPMIFQVRGRYSVFVTDNKVILPVQCLTKKMRNSTTDTDP